MTYPTTLDTVIGIGANIGDRIVTMRAAVSGISRVANLVAISSVYATTPIGPSQPDYLNAAVRVTWTGNPHALLDALLAIEQSLGRVRMEKWGPRTIDLDILWIDGCIVREGNLQVPHPRLHERAFALLPLLEVAPGARDPRTKRVFEAQPASTIVQRTLLRLVE